MAIDLGQAGSFCVANQSAPLKCGRVATRHSGPFHRGRYGLPLKMMAAPAGALAPFQTEWITVGGPESAQKFGFQTNPKAT
jgi:hypothetical protein